jgi:hypothetical protein
MHTHLSYLLAQQHISDLRASADRRRVAVLASGTRPAFVRRLVLIGGVRRRPRRPHQRVTLSPDS